MEAFRALAAEAILIIYAGSSIATGIRLTLVNLIFTLRPGKARLADTFIAVYAIFADSVVTRVASTVVKVDFTVGT